MIIKFCPVCKEDHGFLDANFCLETLTPLEDKEEVLCAHCCEPMAGKHPQYHWCCSWSCARDYYD